MKWLKDQKTMTKMMLSFGLLALIVGAVGFNGIRGTSSINTTLEQLYERHTLGALSLKEADIALISSSRAIRNAILDDNAADIERRGVDIARYREIFSSEFERYRKTIVHDVDRARAEEVERAMKELIPEQDKVYAFARANNEAEAKSRLKGIRAKADRIDALIDELVASKITLMSAAAEQAQASYQSIRTTTVVVVLAAVTLALALGWFLARTISAPLQEAVSVLQAVAGGDFTRTLDLNTKDEVGQMAAALNEAVNGMRNSLLEVQSAAARLSSASQELAGASDQMASGAQEQAASLEETAASLEQITSTVRQNADNAVQANQLAVGSREAAEQGGSVVSSAVAAMAEINASSKRIADIITAIDEIAFQTNLLALNAAVEAARAGEQGRGFAVVAAEVRNLAQRSASAAREIKGLIQDSVRKVESGSSLVNESGRTLTDIITSVKRVTDIVGEITAASHEQSTGIEQVNKAMSQMDQVTQSNSAQTEELSSTAKSLSDQAMHLQQLVSQFKLGESPRNSFAPSSSRVPSAASTWRDKPTSFAPARRSSARSTTDSLASLARKTESNGHALATFDAGFEEF